MNSKNFLLLCTAVVICAGICSAGTELAVFLEESATPAPLRLRCERRTDEVVMGVDTRSPTLEWSMPEVDRAVAVSKYTVQVASDTAFTALVASGDVAVPSTQYTTAMKLTSNTKYFWRVQAVSADGTASAWTEASFATSLLDGEWTASWISAPEGLARSTFSVKAGLARATMYVTAVGYYEAYLNGVKVGDAKLDPGWTTVDKAVLYATYDVTAMLSEGSNAVGIMLAKAWQKPEDVKTMCEIHLEFPGSDPVVFKTDATWKTGVSPIVSADIYNGEVYDARKEQAGWTTTTFDDSKWSAASVVAAPTGVLRSGQFVPIRAIQTHPVRQITMPSPGFYVFDLGQHISGWVRLKVRGPAGTTVRIGHAEVLQHDDSGIPYVEELRQAEALDTFILAGLAGGEVYEPRFTVHGFRYVFITGLPHAPTERTVAGVEVHTDVEQTGNILFSNELWNKIQRMVTWSLQTNMMSVPTDCDQRNERKGWMGDAALTADAAMNLFDTQAFHLNYLRNIIDIESPTGDICDTVPWVPPFGTCPADPAWGTAFPTIARGLLRHFNDQVAVDAMHASLELYMQSMLTAYNKAGPGQMFYHYGDWVPPPPAPMVNSSMTSSFAFLMDVESMSEINQILGKEDNWGKAMPSLKAAWHQAFFDESKGCYADCGQTSSVYALRLGVATGDVLTKLQQVLLDDISKHDTHLTTGIIGTKWLLPVLTAMGRHDVAGAIVSQVTYPSWGYMLENTDEPATTLWELWNANSGDPGMDSRNHHMFGTVSQWMHDHVVGIQINDVQTRTGSPDISIHPGPSVNVTSASGSREVAGGRVYVSWRQQPTNLCTTAAAGQTLQLQCPFSGTITSIRGNVGTPEMLCSSNEYFTRVSFKDQTDDLKKACLGKNSCSYPVADTACSNSAEDPSSCYLGVAAECSVAVNQFFLDVTIPVGHTSLVYVPTTGLSSLTISEGTTQVWANGKFVAGCPGVSAATADPAGQFVVFTVSSGQFSFSTSGSPPTRTSVHSSGVRGNGAPSCPPGTLISAIAVENYSSCDLGLSEMSANHLLEKSCLGQASCPISTEVSNRCASASVVMDCVAE